MTDTEMPRFPGVYPRTDSAVYWFALRAPVDLSHHFPNAWAVRQSLKTRDIREANDKARALQAEWALKFEALRRADNPEEVALNTDLTASVCAELRRWVLEADDNMRSFPEGPRGLLLREARQTVEAQPALASLLPQVAPSRLTLSANTRAATEAPEVDPLGGLSESESAAVARFNAAGAATTSTDMARRNLRGVLPLADAVVKSMGLSVDWTTPEGRDGLLECLKTYTRACIDSVKRDSGEVVDTPPQKPLESHQMARQAGPALTSKEPQGHTPRDAYDAWEAAKPGRPRKSLMTYAASANQLAALLPGRSLESLTRADGRAVVAELLKEAKAKGGTAQNTAHNKLGRFRTLLEQAVDLEWIDKNPFEGRTIERVPVDREPWHLEDIPKLFDSPLFTEYRLPTASAAGKDAAYWLPLLGLYSGARISELAQLHTEDVKEQTDAGWTLTIEEDAEEGQRVKNVHSIRCIPVHPELIRLGFIDYWRAIASHGPGPLWPAVIRGELNGAGAKVGEWFSDYKTAQGFGPTKVYHSLRHTLETQLRALSVPHYHINALAGHAGKGAAEGYSHPTPATLRPVLELLKFPGLELPRVFSAPVWTPKEPRKQ